MTIVEFLEARIAEDELAAQAAIEGSASWQAHYDYRDVKDLEGHFVVQADSLYPTMEQAAHMARQSPARVLRECEAKRAIIADYLRRDALGEMVGRNAVADVMRVLTTVYSDHRDYAGSWT